jgi:hypothetical protein
MAQYQPEYVTGDGGNLTIVNQDEREILDRCVAAVPVVAAPGSQEDDSHTMGVFRRGSVAGS